MSDSDSSSSSISSKASSVSTQKDTQIPNPKSSALKLRYRSLELENELLNEQNRKMREELLTLKSRIELEQKEKADLYTKYQDEKLRVLSREKDLILREADFYCHQVELAVQAKTALGGELKPQVFVPKIPEFSGSKLGFQRWISLVSDLFLKYPQISDFDKRLMVMEALKGQARVWYDTEPNSSTVSWDALRAALFRKYDSQPSSFACKYDDMSNGILYPFTILDSFVATLFSYYYSFFPYFIFQNRDGLERQRNYFNQKNVGESDGSSRVGGRWKRPNQQCINLIKSGSLIKIPNLKNNKGFYFPASVVQRSLSVPGYGENEKYGRDEYNNFSQKYEESGPSGPMDQDNDYFNKRDDEYPRDRSGYPGKDVSKNFQNEFEKNKGYVVLPNNKELSMCKDCVFYEERGSLRLCGSDGSSPNGRGSSGYVLFVRRTDRGIVFVLSEDGPVNADGFPDFPPEIAPVFTVTRTETIVETPRCIDYQTIF
ncbi:hypothetical protein BB560_005882, partial [Smittium megazygosporum]